MRVARLCGLVAGASLLAGCSHYCTEIGCINGVAIEVKKQFSVALLPVEVTVCAADNCSTETIEKSQIAPGQASFGIGPSILLNEKSKRDVEVSLQVRATDAILVNATGTGHLIRSKPNGSGCGPTCYGASLVYDPATKSLIER